MINNISRKRIIQFIIVVLVTSIVVIMYYKSREASSYKCKIMSMDRAIIIETETISSSDFIIYIYEKDKLVEEKKYYNSKNIRYNFTYGRHGSLYNVEVLKSKGLGDFEKVSKEVLFLDYSLLPNLPVYVISTESGDEPTNEVVTNGSSCTMVNNDYEYAIIDVVEHRSVNYSISGKVKCRGNTSSAEKEKKSYKIKFDEPVDLIGDGENKCTEWLLLNNGYSLNTWAGYDISTLIGIENQPKMKFVNVMLNGDWKGIYCLSESVCFETIRDIDFNGIIFEEDSYWWASEKKNFRTDNENAFTKYTIKYPKKMNDKSIGVLKEYMQLIEDLIYAGGDYNSHIDEESFAKWLLVKEIVGNADPYGANIYFTVKDLNILSELRIGPAWDFDNSFANDRVFVNSANREENLGMIKPLCEKNEFNEELKIVMNQQKNMNDKLCLDMELLERNHGEDINKSILLENARWGDNRKDFYTQKQLISEYINKKTKWLEGNIVGCSRRDFDLKYVDITKDYIVDNGYYWGWAYCDAMKDIESSDSNFVIGLSIEDTIFYFNTYYREDVAEAAGIKNSLVGFYGNSNLADGKICIVDVEHMIIYEERE